MYLKLPALSSPTDGVGDTVCGSVLSSKVHMKQACSEPSALAHALTDAQGTGHPGVTQKIGACPRGWGPQASSLSPPPQWLWLPAHLVTWLGVWDLGFSTAALAGACSPACSSSHQLGKLFFALLGFLIFFFFWPA